MLTRAELAAILATCETRHGWDHPLTQRVREEWEALPPETTTSQEQSCEP